MNEIRKLVDHGQLNEAQDALDVLLEFGPSNVDALKLKAVLCAHEGKFQEEEGYWGQILDVDREDRDAIHFFLKRQLQDKERQYFTALVPEGGRKFLAYPRALMKMSMIGLMGCVTFLTMINFVEGSGIILPPWLIFFGFAMMVLMPWVGILRVYFTSVKSVLIGRDGIEVVTRLKTIFYKWHELDKVALTHSSDPWLPNLRLVIMPKRLDAPLICLDLNDDTSAIRARSDLVQEIKLFFHNFSYESFDSLKITDRKIMSF
jgi:hypothetical protein